MIEREVFNEIYLVIHGKGVGEQSNIVCVYLAEIQRKCYIYRK